jgi:prophage regulatory protein
MPETILRLPAVRERVGLSRSSIYDAIAEGSFPSPIKLGERASGWLSSEIESWLKERITKSRDATTKGVS